jgi:hypothetical protein
MKYQHLKYFRVREGDDVNLGNWPTRVHPVYKSRKDYTETSGRTRAQLSSLQQLHYATNRHAVLLIVQAMDAAGKDGAIRHVMSGVNPQGCQSVQLQTSQRHRIATRLSLAHHARPAGARANRHLQPILLRGSADRPCASRYSPRRRASGSTTSQQERSGTTGIDLSWIWNGTFTSTEPASSSSSSTSQRRSSASVFWRASMSRRSNWKFSLGDIEERKFWKQYMKAYERMPQCDKHSRVRPGMLFPPTTKSNARLIVSRDRPRYARRAQDGLP